MMGSDCISSLSLLTLYLFNSMLIVSGKYKKTPCFFNAKPHIPKLFKKSLLDIKDTTFGL